MPNYRNYLAESDVPSNEILDDWRWLVDSNLQLLWISKAGDAFLRDPSSGEIYFLDTVGGKVEAIAKNEAQFALSVAIPANLEHWLMAEIVDGQAMLGIIPGKNECLSFKLPPVLGGQIEPENIETCDVRVHFSIAGQIHEQTKDLPEGTKIGKVYTAPEVQSIKPWWKFW